MGGFLWIIALSLCPAGSVRAGQEPSRELVVNAGRPLRVMLEQRTRIKDVGQPVTGTLVEDVYSFDRVVIPKGTKVLGKVVARLPVPSTARAAAMLGGNFSPNHQIGLQFDTVVLDTGAKVSIRTIVTPGTAPATQEVAGAHDDGIVGHARRQVADEARRAVSSVKAPGKMARLGHYMVGRLPMHPQYLEAGSVFNAQLVEPVSLGTAASLPRALPGVRPAPDSVLQASLLTGLDSAKSPRGAAVKAILTRPLLSQDNELILPEGTLMTGKVTFVKAAKGFRRNGQLRFLFETIEVPGQEAERLGGSLYSADVGNGQHLVIDEEGGTKVTNPKSRFIAPAMAGAAALVAVDNTEISDEGLGVMTTQANVVGRGIKGFSGFGLLGTGLTLVSRPAAIGFGVFGLARTVYVSLLGKGHEVVFPASTPIQIQLAPEAPAQK
jgi:hypothetical protein